jgi:hypothetical protein
LLWEYNLEKFWNLQKPIASALHQTVQLIAGQGCTGSGQLWHSLLAGVVEEKIQASASGGFSWINSLIGVCFL